MRIEVSQLPPPACSPNSRVHWALRYQDAYVYRNAVFYSCIDAKNKLAAIGEWRPFGRVRIYLTFIYPVHRRRDRDNLIAMFKPGLDAIIAAGLVADDDVEHVIIGEVNADVSRSGAPLTVIELEEK